MFRKQTARISPHALYKMGERPSTWRPFQEGQEQPCTTMYNQWNFTSIPALSGRAWIGVKFHSQFIPNHTGQQCNLKNLYGFSQIPLGRFETVYFPNPLLVYFPNPPRPVWVSSQATQVPQFDGDLRPNISHKNASYDKKSYTATIGTDWIFWLTRLFFYKQFL